MANVLAGISYERGTMATVAKLFAAKEREDAVPMVDHNALLGQALECASTLPINSSCARQSSDR